MGPEPDSPQLNEPSAAGAGAETATTGRPPVVVAWLTPLLIIAGACTAGAGSRDGDPTSPSSVNGSGGAGGSSGSGGASAAQGGGLNLGGHGPTAVGCTADLQATVDDQGNIVEQCPPDKGCLEGICVPACEAAAASKGSIGCEYYVPYPPFYQNNTSPNSYDGACHAMFVANTWGRHAQLTANYGGQSYDVTSFARIPSGVAQATQYMPLPALGLPPGEVAVLFLSHKPGAAHSLGSSLECPITPAVTIDTAAHNSGVATAFEVISDTPITGYDIMPYGGAQSYLPSASLLYPRTAWGTNYYAIAPANPSLGQQWLLVVGTADNTTVEIVAPVTLPAGTGVPAATANTLTPITLGAGELVQWMGADPSGSVLQSSAPIGVWGGNTYLRVPSATSSGGGAQDSAHQQIPPISALGSEYVGGGVVSRLSSLSPESVPYRLLGVVDGTQLTWDPPVGSAPATLDAGQVVEMETASLVRVSSQDEDHPFAFSQYMPGCPGVTIAGCGPSPPRPTGKAYWSSTAAPTGQTSPRRPRPAPAFASAGPV